MKQPRTNVTDHALVRYLERVYGLDLDPVRAEIADKVALGVSLEASAVVRDGFRYVLANGNVVTVIRRQRQDDAQASRDGMYWGRHE